MICIVIIAISAGSRALARVFSAPEKRAFRARNLFFLYLFHRTFWLSSHSASIFLCYHKHIQSFVNSVLIIAKTLSLSFSKRNRTPRARLLSRHQRKRARKKEREKEIQEYFFSCDEKKGVHEKKKERKKRKETEKTLTRKDDTKSSFLVLFLFRSFNEEEHHLEKTEKRSIKKGSEQ